MFLSQFHASGWSHGDIKPDNVIFSNATVCAGSGAGLVTTLTDTRAKVIDMGLAFEGVPIGRAGIRGYQAPEIVAAQAHSHPAGIWAAGRSLVTMLTGNSQRQIDGLYDKLRREAADPAGGRGPYAAYYSALFDFLSSRSLDRDPSTRITAEKALGHRLFCLDPEDVPPSWHD